MGWGSASFGMATRTDMGVAWPIDLKWDLCLGKINMITFALSCHIK